MKLKTTIILLALCFAHSAGADVVRVPNDFATIQEAIDNASDGDTVLVDPGTYVENIAFHGKRVVLGSLFLTTGDESFISQTIIDGNRDSTVVSFQDFEPEGTALVGFSIRNGLGTGNWPNVRGGGIHIGAFSFPLIRYCYIYENESVGSSNRGAGIFMNSTSAGRISNCKIYNNTSLGGAGIHLGNGSFQAVVDSCEVFDNRGNGITVSFSYDVTISRTLIYNNDGRGFRSHETNNTKLTHSTIVNNGGPGLIQSTSPAGDSLYILNSIIYGNGEASEIENDSLVFATYSIIENGDGRLWFGAGCTSAQPLYEGETLAPAANSPAVDGGDPSSKLDPDVTRADIGALYRPQEVTSVLDVNAQPAGFSLFNNYPNPFNPGTSITYAIDSPSVVELKIYDALGRFIRTLAHGLKPSGEHKISWDGRDASGQEVASGVYYYRLRTQGETLTRQMLLLR